MNQVDVHFADRHAAFEAYWGYLAGGGLIVPLDEVMAAQGQPITLCVRLGGGSPVSLAGRLARVSGAGHAVVAFVDPDVNDKFLELAVRGDGVELEAQVLHDGIAQPMRLRNVSEQGCCLDLAGAGCDVGSDVTIQTSTFCVSGCVVWSDGNARYIMFDEPSPLERTLHAS